MKYYPLLTEDEIQTLCLCYPYKLMITGFKRCYKDFSSLMPGHRPQSVGTEAGRNLIANNPHSRLTAKMLEVLLLNWCNFVSTSVKNQISEGKEKDYAYIIAFSELETSSFVRIFFHLSDIGFSEEHISAIIAGVDALFEERSKINERIDSSTNAKQIDEIKREHNRELKEKDKEIKKILTEKKILEAELSKERETTTKLTKENQRIPNLLEQLSKSAEESAALSNTIKEVELKLKEAKEAYIESERREQAVREEADAIRAELYKCQAALMESEEKHKAIYNLLYSDTTEELRPVNMSEFSEYLSYNLSNLGLEKSTSYFSLLAKYLGDTVFCNRPIICNHAIGLALAKCISNTLCGSQNPTIIPYQKGITSNEIKGILESDSRIVIFDSFIGNYSEMELFPIIRSVKRKIIFITAEYDKTISYLLPEEVLLNSTYINASKIPELFMSNELNEDPSTIREELSTPFHEEPNRKAQRLCREIMIELGFQNFVADSIAERMTSEDHLNGCLAFSILPYSINAFGIAPYNVSDRLNKYVGLTGKSAYKELIMEWYGNV